MFNWVLNTPLYLYKNRLISVKCKCPLKYLEPWQTTIMEVSCKNSWPFKRQSHKMVKHAQTIRQLLPANCLSVFDHFVWFALKELTALSFFSIIISVKSSIPNIWQDLKKISLWNHSAFSTICRKLISFQ